MQSYHQSIKYQYFIQGMATQCYKNNYCDSLKLECITVAMCVCSYLVLLGGAGACLPFLLVARRSWTTVERADRMPGPGRTSLERLGLLPSSMVLCLFLLRLRENEEGRSVDEL